MLPPAAGLLKVQPAGGLPITELSQSWHSNPLQLGQDKSGPQVGETVPVAVGVVVDDGASVGVSICVNVDVGVQAGDGLSVADGRPDVQVGVIVCESMAVNTGLMVGDNTGEQVGVAVGRTTGVFVGKG